MKQGSWRVCLALLAMFSLVFSTSGIAFAAEDQTSTVEVEATGGAAVAEEYGDITTASGDGLYVSVDDEGASATVTAEDIDAAANGVNVYNEGTAMVTVGDIAADTGLYVASGGDTTIETGDIDSVTGARISVWDGETEIETGNIDATADVVSAYVGGGELTMTTGDLSTDGSGTEGSYNVHLDVNGGSADITTGNITSTDEYGTGVYVEAENGGSADVTVDGDITSAGMAAAVYASESTAALTVNGDVSADYPGVEAWASGEDADASLTVNGDLTSGWWYGAGIDAADSGTAELTIGGDVTVTDGDGLQLTTGSGGAITVAVDGDVTASGTVQDYSFDRNNSPAAGIWASVSDDMEESSIDVLVTGTITGEDYGVVLDNTQGYETDSSNFTLTVWQIVPNDDGAVAATYTDNIDQLPDGVGDIEYSYAEDEDFEKTIKYIIKVEQPSEGGTVSATDADGNALETSHDYDVAYEGDTVLLKVNLEDGYRILAAYNGEGQETELLMDSDGNYYVVVPKGGGVYLSVELSNEYNVSFVDDDGTELQSGLVEYGNTPSYTGATPAKASTAQYDYTFAGWTPEIDAVTGEITYTATYSQTLRSYDLTFDLGGGTLNGQTGTITMNFEYGSTINLPSAPTREGFTFLYWAGSQYDAGAEYTVEGAHAFTAVWQENEETTDDNTDDTDPGITDDNTDDTDAKKSSESTTKVVRAAVSTTAAAPATGDNSQVGIWSVVMTAAALGLAFIFFRRRRYCD